MAKKKWTAPLIREAMREPTLRERQERYLENLLQRREMLHNILFKFPLGDKVTENKLAQVEADINEIKRELEQK